MTHPCSYIHAGSGPVETRRCGKPSTFMSVDRRHDDVTWCSKHAQAMDHVMLSIGAPRIAKRIK